MRHEVPVLIATKGIFHMDRSWVTHVELMTAIDAGKSVIIVRCPKDTDAFDLDSKDENGDLKEFEDVAEDFLPYAKALINSCEIVDWASQKDDRETKVKQICQQYMARKENAKKLQRVLKRMKA
jgi:hypothetical protein